MRGGPDLVVGPVLACDPRVLAVAADHRLAAREQVSIEDIADYPVTECAGVPRDIMEAFVPPRTPGGRPIRRIPQRDMETMLDVSMASAACPRCRSLVEQAS